MDLSVALTVPQFPKAQCHPLPLAFHELFSALCPSMESIFIMLSGEMNLYFEKNEVHHFMSTGTCLIDSEVNRLPLCLLADAVHPGPAGTFPLHGPVVVCGCLRVHRDPSGLEAEVGVNLASGSHLPL